MKKLSILLLSVAAFCITHQDAQAQIGQDEVAIGNRVYEAKKFRFGAYVAPTISWMKPTANKSNDGSFSSTSGGSGLGFMYGLMAEYQFAENYAIVSGLQMNMAKGHIISENSEQPAPNSSVTKADFDYKLNYVELPIGLKMRTDQVGGFRFFGQAGFGLGVNIGKKADYTINYIDENGVNQIKSGENEIVRGNLAVSPILVSMNIGGGLEYPINNKLAAYFGIFFNNGFVPDATNPTKYNLGTPGFKDGNTRVNNFAFRLGLFF